nr:uncharacterized protein LOC106731966 isoform X1 [Pelodiscus sinensis]|eukprot:XP_025040024.1 uncharacterized protein LOC106731966 isoform X1 [Pelodiscus sinensis]
MVGRSVDPGWESPGVLSPVHGTESSLLHAGPTPPISGALTMAFLTQDQQSMITRGMKSLVSLARELSSSSVNPDAHKEMQGHARRACEEMKAVESQLESQKHIVDSHYVTLLEKRAHLNNEKSQRELSQALLQIQLKHHANTKAYAQEMLSAAEGHLKELQDLQKEVRKEKNWLKMARTIALLFMPLSTLMAGIVAAIFQTSLNMAQRADRELQKAIDLYNTKISEYKQSLCRYDLEKEEIDVKSHADEKKMEALTRELLELEKTMEKKEQFLRNLSLLVGNLEVLESKLDIDYETTWEVLAVDVLESLEGDQRLLNFLDGKEIRSLVQDLKKIIKSRAAI